MQRLRASIIIGKTTTDTIHHGPCTPTREITPYLWVHPDEEK
jgi:hypothetical protein